MPYAIQLHIAGDLACFTRPEMKVERVSYDVITPSAGRGIIALIEEKRKATSRPHRPTLRIGTIERL